MLFKFVVRVSKRLVMAMYFLIAIHSRGTYSNRLGIGGKWFQKNVKNNFILASVNSTRLRLVK